MKRKYNDEGKRLQTFVPNLNGYAQCLTCKCGDSKAYPDGINAVMIDDIRIRKLTPRECWRLQGFPDEYFDKAKASGVSDSQLYKQAGNAVTVNVARAIGEKLVEIYKSEQESE